MRAQLNETYCFSVTGTGWLFSDKLHGPLLFPDVMLCNVHDSQAHEYGSYPNTEVTARVSAMHEERGGSVSMIRDALISSLVLNCDYSGT